MKNERVAGVNGGRLAPRRYKEGEIRIHKYAVKKEGERVCLT